MNNVVFIPGSPALIPDLSPQDAPSLRLLKAAVELISEAKAGGIEQIDIVFSRDKRWYTAHEGSFRAWGAPQVEVGQGQYLGELVARYILRKAGVNADVAIESRGNIGELNSEALTVVVVDGSAGLTPRAPLALIDSAQGIHLWCQQVLQGEASDMPSDKLVQSGIIEPELWLELSKLQPRHAVLVDADLSLGVGRYVAAWEV